MLIPLNHGQVAIVDDEDYPLVQGFNWYARRDRSSHTFYVQAAPHRGVTILMHRLILGAKEGELVDHRDCDGLNNSRSNLRLATRSQSGANRRFAKLKGVHRLGPAAKTKPWQAQIKVDGKVIHLGTFATEKEAAEAYNRAAIQHFGEFARLNQTDAS